jgi:exosortase H (IPTLxxWG-CTERM-specific)
MLVVYYAITVIPWVDREVIYPVLEATTRSSSWLLNLAGAETTAQGVTIQGSQFAVRVQRGCDPLEPIVLLGAAIMAFPAALGKKLGGFFCGAVVLFGLNLLRVASLYLAGGMRPGWFETVHQEVWPALFVVFALLLWVFWVAWTLRSAKGADAC